MASERVIHEQIEQIFNGANNYAPVVGISVRWYNWMTAQDPKVCLRCRYEHGRIRESVSTFEERPPLHPNCRCVIIRMESILAGTATIDRLSGADYYLKHYGRLPGDYITKKEAKRRGWVYRQGNLYDVAPGKQISGGIYRNSKRKLPIANGRIWYEADINYRKGFRKGGRVLYSNDGLIFITYDHYESFFEIV